jgi:hypothetical protein
MTENIGQRLLDLCGAAETPIVLYLSEAESEDYPYAVYDADYVPYYDKDGVYKVVGDISVRAYAKKAATAQEVADAINAIVLTNFSTGGYTVRQLSQLKKECLQETWSVGYQYRITQYRTTTA